MKQIISISLFVFLYSNSLIASHLIGGDMTYECLGNNQYQFNLKVYRDCNSINPQGNLTPFDNQAYITVYRIVSNGTYIQEQALQIPLGNQYTTDASPSDACLVETIPYCVDVGEYQAVVTLPLDTNGYVISYQRCCKTNTISNIANPGQTGSTLTVSLNGQAQSNCNNTPQFTAAPPAVLCVGDNLNISNYASDMDGDSLVYSLCAPLIGASVQQPQPFTISPPPYSPVTYVSPYSATNPINSNPAITIDSSTGTITGTPLTLGQYVIGICIDEYRNGVFLSSVSREIMVNVTNCQPILSTLSADTTNINGDLVFKYCYLNASLLPTNINWLNSADSIDWQFSTGNFTLQSNAVYPHFTFPNYGTFQGHLSILGSNCADTIPVEFQIHQPPISNFTFMVDSIFADSVVFTNTSSSSGNLVSWQWNFGGGNTSSLFNPSHEFSDTGTYNVYLVVGDDNGCTHDTVMPVPYYPVQLVSNDKTIAQIDVKMYPNPAKDQFSLEFTDIPQENLTIQVYNSMGQQIVNLNNWNSNLSLKFDTRHWVTGVYFITIQQEGKALKSLKLLLE